MIVRVSREREWMWHRQAYWPRLWPRAGAATVSAWALTAAGWWLMGLDGGVELVIWPFSAGLITSSLVMEFDHWRWKRKHPVISDQQLRTYAAAQLLHELRGRQEAAPWN